MSIFIILLIIAIVAILTSFINSFEESQITKRERTEINLKKQENSNKFNELKNSFGQTSKIINYNLCKFILISDSRNIIMINDNVYNFNDILTFEIKDNSSTIFISTSKTSTNTSSMLGRSIVGGALSGGVGAIIGGTTASKTTQTEGNSKISHNYTITVTVNNLSTPIITLHIGKNGKIVNEIAAILNIILNKNSSNLEQCSVADIDTSNFIKFYEYLPEYFDEELEQLIPLQGNPSIKNTTKIVNILDNKGIDIDEYLDFYREYTKWNNNQQ